MRANKTELPIMPASRCNVPCFKGELVARLRKHLPVEPRLERALVVFGALAERQRLKILYALQEAEELCVCDVAHVLGVSISTASHHLRRLRDLGILRDRDDGKMVYYSLGKSAVAGLVSRALAHVSR